MTWQLSFKHYNVQMIRRPLWEMTIKHPARKKRGLLLLILKLNVDIAVKENLDQKIAQEVEDAKPLLFSNLEDCNGGADISVVRALVRLPPFVAVMPHCDAPATNGLQRSGSWRFLGAA